MTTLAGLHCCKMTFASYGKWVGDSILFNDVLESDQRTPCMIFTMPNSILRLFHMEGGGDKFGLLAPQLEFWIALAVVRILFFPLNLFEQHFLAPTNNYLLSSYHFFLLQTLLLGSIFSSCISCMIYHLIVLPQKLNKKKSKHVESMTPFIIGFGIIMPICAAFPYFFLRHFYVKNKILKFLSGLAQLTTFFRCSEGE